MRVVFFGTPAFAVPALDALITGGHDVAAVVTQPDRARTRSHSTLLPSPVKVRAESDGIPVLQPERPRGDLFDHQMRDFDADLGVVVAYGHLLRSELLAIPRLGMVNVHASLLPRWRGAAPIQWAVIEGDSETGVSIMKIEAGLDSGPVWHRSALPINSTDTSGGLFGRLADLGATALIEALPAIEQGEKPVEQDPELVTMAPKLDRQLARLDWSRSAEELSCWIRGMDPVPGAWSEFEATPIKLFSPRPVPARGGPPGGFPGGGELIVACGEGALEIGEVQPAGRRRMSASDWVRGIGAKTELAFA